jgi:hypothetical protein
MSQTSHVQFDPTWDTEHRRSILTKFLHQGPCEVTFIKVDGSKRIMPCTLQENLLPPRLSESKKTKSENSTALSAWCLDKKEWRSFKIDNVLEIREIDQ